MQETWSERYSGAFVGAVSGVFSRDYLDTDRIV